MYDYFLGLVIWLFFVDYSRMVSNDIVALGIEDCWDESWGYSLFVGLEVILIENFMVVVGRGYSLSNGCAFSFLMPSLMFAIHIKYC